LQSHDLPLGRHADATETVTCCATMALVPIVHSTVARPLAVVGPLGFVRLPPPETTAKSTATPAMGFPRPSSTSATSGCASFAPTGPLWKSPPNLSNATGTCATLTLAVPLTPPEAATTCVEPFPAAMTSPPGVTVATPVLFDDHVIVALRIVSPR